MGKGDDGMPFEEMAAFFDARADGYEAHMMQNVFGSDRFYVEMVKALPLKPGLRLLDLGCGTGLELDVLFSLCPDAQVTGIDLSKRMLDALREKHAGRALTLIQGDYFKAPFPGPFDAAVSVETMHHFEAEAKIRLYRKIAAALKPGGCYVETDFVASDDAFEASCLTGMRSVALDRPAEFYHIDIPMTPEHLLKLMRQAFTSAEHLWQAGSTAIFRAML
jgi:tRNA (cmo5U34)-methyltransferase